MSQSSPWREGEAPPDIRLAFEAYAGAGGTQMTLDQLRRFLAEQQGEPLVDAGADEDDHLRQLQYRQYLTKLAQAQPLLNLSDFVFLLFSDEFNPPIGSKVYQEMTAPLSHYYIYTGHNSYLTGNQLSSDCSDVPIKDALQKGVRVIELDIWPNFRGNDIDVLHGRTLTSPVKLIKCLRTIKEYAFCASQYPLVITLEDHLTPELQAKVAEMVIQTFGDMVYLPRPESRKEFPCPEDLKERIVLSTKPPKEYLESDKMSRLKAKGKISPEETWGKDIIEIGTTHEKECDKYEEDIGDDDDDDDDDDSLPRNSAPEYKHLIAIRAGKPKGGLRCALNGDPDKVRRLSLSEQELVRAANEHGKALIRFTQKNLLRVYPKGTRVNSSNYNPLVGWTHGAQMVAFNMQGHGKSLWLMQGFFRANGGCGYVKKPDFLLNVGPYGDVFDPNANLPVEKTLKVKLYLGDGWRLDFSSTHFDTFSPPDFYAKIGIAGVPVDCIMRRTRTIMDNWAPVWDEEFTFPLTVPELALLRIQVYEHDVSDRDDFGGQTCLPVSDLRPGIRAVPLYDKKGTKLKSVRLLVHFSYV